jgi:hypothetical protein
MEVMKMETDDEIDDENVITTGLSMETILGILDDFGIENEDFWRGIKDLNPKYWITEWLDGDTRMLVTDGNSRCVMIRPDEDNDPENMIVVLPVFGDWCGIPFDFIRAFEDVINGKKPKPERRRTRSRRHRVTH